MAKFRNVGCVYAKLHVDVNWGLNNALLLFVLRLKLFNAAENEPPPQGMLCARPPL